MIFDGYIRLDKDTICNGGSGKVSQLVVIHDKNLCASDRKEFLSNCTDKQRCATSMGKKTLHCVAGANTIIAKNATDAVNKPVRIISDGTDIWCLLIQHTLNNSSKVTYLETMRIEKDSDERVRYNTEGIIHTFNEVTL